MWTVHGIPNCDTVKQARAWLAAAGVEHRFHDFKREGVPRAALQRWIAAVGWPALLNRRGTTWRALDAVTQAKAVDAASVAALLQDHPSLIKRPVLARAEGQGPVLVGFDPARYAEATGRRPI